MNTLACYVYLSVVLLLNAGWADKFRYPSEQSQVPKQQILILGFMGGRNKADDLRFGVAKLAKRLREMDLPCVRVETMENSKRASALELVRNVFDQNHDGHIDAAERAGTLLILYGQSFGGAAVVKFARQLQAEGIPVALTVEVDAVGLDDDVIPSNVSAAANLFQHDDSFIHGPKEIRAADPHATEILGNFKFSYRHSSIDVSDLPWRHRVFEESHVRMDRDPAVWAKVEELILAALARAGRCNSR